MPVSFDYCEHLIGVDGSAFTDANLDYVARLWRLDFVLHLHRFDHNDALTLSYLISRSKQHANDFPGHRRNQFLPAFGSVLNGWAPVLAVDNLC